jgi:hypothetical protein
LLRYLISVSPWHLYTVYSVWMPTLKFFLTNVRLVPFIISCFCRVVRISAFDTLLFGYLGSCLGKRTLRVPLPGDCPSQRGRQCPPYEARGLLPASGHHCGENTALPRKGDIRIFQFFSIVLLA